MLFGMHLRAHAVVSWLLTPVGQYFLTPYKKLSFSWLRYIKTLSIDLSYSVVLPTSKTNDHIAACYIYAATSGLNSDAKSDVLYQRWLNLSARTRIMTDTMLEVVGSVICPDQNSLPNISVEFVMNLPLSWMCMKYLPLNVTIILITNLRNDLPIEIYNFFYKEPYGFNYFYARFWSNLCYSIYICTL